MKPSIGAAKTFLRIALFIAVLPVLSILIGALATKTGVLDWKIGFGLLTFKGPPLIAMASVLTGLIGLVIALMADAKGLWVRGVVPLIITLVVFAGFGSLMAKAKGVPMIHDVATDWSEPLAFSPAVMAARGPDSNPVVANPVGPDKVPMALINAKSCPDAKPVMLAESPAMAYVKVKAALEIVGLTLVTDEPATGRIEAVATSSLYGFKDDVVARVKARDAGTQVDFRSVSRVGLSDLGANCKRIVAIRSALVK